MDNIRENKAFVGFLILSLILGLASAKNLLGAKRILQQRGNTNASLGSEIQTRQSMLGADPSHVAAATEQLKQVQIKADTLRQTLQFSDLDKYASKTNLDEYGLVMKSIKKTISTKATQRPTVQFNSDAAIPYQATPHDIAEALRQAAVLEHIALLACQSHVYSIVECKQLGTPKGFPNVGEVRLARPYAASLTVQGSIPSLLDLLTRLRQPGQFLGIATCTLSPNTSNRKQLRQGDMEMIVEAYALDIEELKTETIGAVTPEPEAAPSPGVRKLPPGGGAR